MDGSLVTEAVNFLLEPWSGAAVHHVPVVWAWHGRLMVLAGAVLLPVGVMLARYYKVTRRQHWPGELDNRFWWNGHLLAQYLGIGLMTGAAGIVWMACSDTGSSEWTCSPDRMTRHELAGLATLGAGWMQIALGLARGSKGGPTDAGANPDNPDTWRGDHYDMTPRRIWFEWSHKVIGYLALVLAVIAIITGLVHADAPRWMFLVLLVWWTGLLAWAVRMQRQGRNIDTYQAIWGPDPSLPGAKRKPTGFGVRRVR